MIWRLVIDYFGPNIQQRSVVYNKVADALRSIPTMNGYWNCTSTCRYLHHDNGIFKLGINVPIELFSPLHILVSERTTTISNKKSPKLYYAKNYQMYV